MTYDIAAGLDNPTLNTLIQRAYSLIYPNLFRNTFTLDQVGITTVTVDIDTAPAVNLTPVNLAELLQTHFEPLASADTTALTPEARATLEGMVEAASFTLSLPSIKLTIDYSSGAPATTAQAAVNGVLNVQAVTSGGSNRLTVQLVSASISIPGNPVLQDLLNNAFVPSVLIPYLNTNVLEPIQVPTLAYDGFQVSLPVLAVQPPNLVAYAALGATQPDLPAPGSWPSGCVFVAVDIATLQTAASIPFPLGPGTGFDWDIISGRVEAQVHAPTNLSVNPDGSVNATIIADVLAQLTLHTPWPLPNVSFGPSAQASLSVALKPSVVSNELRLALGSVPIPTFSFSWGIPDWINWLFYPLEAGLAAALNAALEPLLSNLFSGLPAFGVYTIPTVSIDLGGKTLSIEIAQATTAGQNGQLVVSAQPNLS